MFKLVEKHEYWWPCTAQVPVNGAFEKQKFSLKFETLTDDEAEALDKEIIASLESGDRSKRDAMLLRVVKDWTDVEGPDGKPMEFSENNLVEVLKRFPWFRKAAYQGWRESQDGAAKLGN